MCVVIGVEGFSNGNHCLITLTSHVNYGQQLFQLNPEAGRPNDRAGMKQSTPVNVVHFQKVSGGCKCVRPTISGQSWPELTSGTGEARQPIK